MSRQKYFAGNLIMNAVWLDRLDRAEYLLLCGLALCLPILETPKNLIVFLLLVVWIARFFIRRDHALSRPDIVGISLLFMLASSLVSTVVNWPLVNGLKGFQHTLMQVLVFWILYRALLSSRQQLRIVWLIALGVMIGLAWKIMEYAQGRHEYLSLPSVGGVIESATYIGIALAVTFSVAWARPTGIVAVRGMPAGTLWWVAAAVMLVGLVLTGNRGAILAVLAAFGVYALVIGKRSIWLAIAAVIAAMILATMTLPNWFQQDRWLAKVQEMISTGQLVPADQERIDHWRVGIARVAQGDALIFGIGPHNTITIDYSKMEFDPQLMPITSLPGSIGILHTHNMFLTKLVEEGVVGLLAMLLFFGVVITRLVWDYRKSEWRNWSWMAAAGGFTVALVSGQVGPRWHQEHALLVMMVLGIYFGSRRLRNEDHAPG